jgi:hypothetical protein
VDTVNFIQRLVGFIDATYIEYKVLSYMGEDKLWELLVSFIEQVFEDLRAAWCMIQDASEGESSLLLWWIMRAHDVMEEYIKHDFRKHPALNGILVQRILRSSPTSGMHARVQSVEKTITGINGTLPGIKTRLSAVEVRTAKALKLGRVGWERHGQGESEWTEGQNGVWRVYRCWIFT